MHKVFRLAVCLAAATTTECLHMRTTSAEEHPTAAPKSDTACETPRAHSDSQIVYSLRDSPAKRRARTSTSHTRSVRSAKRARGGAGKRRADVSEDGATDDEGASEQERMADERMADDVQSVSNPSDDDVQSVSKPSEDQESTDDFSSADMSSPAFSLHSLTGSSRRGSVQSVSSGGGSKKNGGADDPMELVASDSEVRRPRSDSDATMARALTTLNVTQQPAKVDIINRYSRVSQSGHMS